MRVTAIVLAFLLLAPFSRAQQEPSTRFLLVLPDYVSSERVQIEYMERGSFGGLRGAVQPRPGLRAYELKYHGGELSIIAYVPGCDVEVLLLTRISKYQRLLCEPMPTVNLHAQVAMTDDLAGRDVEVEATYEANGWAFPFFGVVDGPPVAFPALAKAKVSQTGEFTIALPDFARSRTLSLWANKGQWFFLLVDGATGERIKPHKEGGVYIGFNVSVLASYPDIMKFTPVSATYQVVR